MTLTTRTTSPSGDLLADYDEALEFFDPAAGIEVHVELNTASKAFCGCSTVFGADPNTQTCPVCLGMPGALPVVNIKVIESAIRLGLMLNCTIAPWSRFARKNYFYPDMPKNFQTSQYDEPIAFDGYLDVTLEDGATARILIERAHMEEDTGKSTHIGGATGRIHGANHSLVDYNRAGIPLIEIVTKPIVGYGARTPEVLRAYVAALRDVVLALGISDARMDQGSVRADVNVSLASKGAAKLGTRTETKNVNSFRSIERASRYEICRQAALLDDGGTVTQETRHWHEDRGVTTSGREKSDADDYRYFPEPDLVPVAPSEEWIEKLRSDLPEMPATRRARLQAEWGYTDLEMRDVLNAGAVNIIEATVDAGTSAAAARKWWLGDLARVANERGVELYGLGVSAENIVELQGLIDSGKLNDKLARQVLEGVLAGEGSPAAVAEARGLEIVSDDSALLTAVDEALAAQPDVVEKIKGGKVQAAGAIVGAVMKATRGQADAARVRELIMERVNGA